jgi:F-type H+-transporting ATPase subunit b
MAESTSAHTEEPGGAHKEPFPPFQKDTFASQLLWLAITFVALYLLVAKLGLPRVGSILEARNSRIAGDRAEASDLKAQAEDALASYQKALADARGRAQTIAGEMRQKLTAEADKNRRAVEERLNARLLDAEKSIAKTKAAAMANVGAIAIEAASAIVARLIGAVPGEKAVAAAVDAVLKQ